MASHTKIFTNNIKAIEQRCLGAVVQHFARVERQEYNLEADTLAKIFSTTYKAENIVSYHKDTMLKIQKYFQNQCTGADFSDFQCVLVLDIYKDYVK